MLSLVQSSNLLVPIRLTTALPAKPTTSPNLNVASSRTNPLPAAIQGWRLWSGNAGEGASDSRVAYYQQGNEIVEVTLIRIPNLRPMLRHPLQACAGGVRTVASPIGTLQVLPHEALCYGRDCLFFDYTPKGAGWRIFTANPYLPNSPHTISWYAAPYVATVAADTPQVRDAFAQAYLAAVKQ